MFNNFDHIYVVATGKEGTVIGTRQYWSVKFHAFDTEYEVEYHDYRAFPRNEWFQEHEIAHISHKYNAITDFKLKQTKKYDINIECPKCGAKWLITKFNNQVWKDCNVCKKTAEQILEE
jgi:hypothetical protein